MERIYWLEEWNAFGAKKLTPRGVAKKGRILHWEEALILWDERMVGGSDEWTVDAWRQMESICEACDEREGKICEGMSLKPLEKLLGEGDES